MLFKTKLNVVNTLKILSIFLSINVIKIINIKYKIKDKINLVYIIFIVLAHFIGVILNFYDKFLYYDKFVHFLFGIVCSYIAFNILKVKNIVSKLLLVIIITMFLATMWEVYEYLASIIFKIDPQNNITTGVNDTMQDIIVALIGSIIFNLMCLRSVK
jgi:uncharacterized membrane protein YjdF